MQTGFCHGLSPEWEQHSDLGKEEGYKLCQLAFPNKMKPCGKWNPFHSEKCPKPSVSPAPIQRLPPVSMVVILAAAVGRSLSKLMKKNICKQNNNKKKKENINANNGTISRCCQSNIYVTFLHSRVLLCSSFYVVTDGQPLLCFIGRRRGGGGARRGLSNHRILPLPHPAVSSLQGKRLPWPLIIDFPLSFDHFRLFIFVFPHSFILVWFRFVINTHNTSERNPKNDANANKHLADDNWSRLAVSTSHKLL